MANPLPEAKTKMSEALTKRTELLEKGEGSFPVWKIPKDLADQKKALDASNDVIGKALGEKDQVNLPLSYRQANIILQLSRDWNRSRTDRVARAAEYLRMSKVDIDNNLSVRLPKAP